MRTALAPILVVDREIGGGSMGAVFLGHDPALDRDVAIKVLRPEMAGAVGAERFRREARLLAKLQHPHVVPVHQAGEADGLFYFVMDLVRGETLQTRLARGALSPDRTVAIAHDLLDALGAGHRLGIIHRDVKPANIFLSDRGAMLADFGIAKVEPGPELEPLTDHGPGPGTPGYMAPEQAAGGTAVPESDLYSVAMVLYECLTGRRWVSSADPAGADWSAVPPRLVTALSRALQVDPRRRWRSADEFRRALADRRRWWRLAIPAAVAVILVAAGLLRHRPQPAGASGPELDQMDLKWSPGRLALPSDSGAFRQWRQAEQAYRQGRWAQAGAAYRAALDADSTCLICRFRLTDINRWRLERRNAEDQRQLARQTSRFTDYYASLIQADTAHQVNRLILLDDVTHRYGNFPLGQYLYGEELFNRGPLFGRDRSQAIEHLERATIQDPGFAPPRFDLALAWIAEGDSAKAAAAVKALDRFGKAEDLAAAERALAAVAFAARFGGSPATALDSALTDPTVDSLGLKNAGPRLLAGLGSPDGAVLVGRRFEEVGNDSAMRRSGLVAQVIGLAGLGRVSAMRRAADQLVATTRSRPEWRVFTAQLEAAMVLADSAPSPQALEAAADRLSPFAMAGQDWPIRRAACWMLGILAARGGRATVSECLRSRVAEPGSPLPLLLRAAGMPPDEALRTTDSLDSDLEAWDRERDPFVRAVFKLSRAGWAQQIGNLDAARKAYLWHEHFNLATLPVDEPVPSDGDWALATIAYWRLARMLEAKAGNPANWPGLATDLCDAYRAVRERWSEGDAPYRSRADAARDRLQALKCPIQ